MEHTPWVSNSGQTLPNFTCVCAGGEQCLSLCLDNKFQVCVTLKYVPLLCFVHLPV